MRRYVLTAAAEADLVEIADFIGEDSPEAARGVVSENITDYPLGVFGLV